MTSLNKSGACRIVFFRILIIIVADIIVSYLFGFINSDASRQYAFHMDIQTPVTIVFGILTALAVAYLVVTKVKKIDTSAQYMTPVMIAAAALYLLITAVFFDSFTTSPFLFYTMTVIASVLFAVYYIYTILLYKK